MSGKIATKLESMNLIRKFIVNTTSKKTGVKTPGGRLHIPEACPTELRVLMEALWSFKKKDRPSALQSILFLLRACTPIMGEAKAWENDAESAIKMKEWLVDDIGIPVPRAEEVFEMFNYEVLVQDDGLSGDVSTLLGAEFVQNSPIFKAMDREIMALRMLNEAVEQEPLKSALANACAAAEAEKGSKEMQAALLGALSVHRQSGDKEGGETKGDDAAIFPGQPALVGAIVDHGTGTSTTMEHNYHEQTCVCMWNEVGESEGAGDEGGLKNFDDLVHLWYRNLEEYAVSGTIVQGELPFVVQFCSHGRLPALHPGQNKDLRDHFCAIDMSKPEGQRRK